MCSRRCVHLHHRLLLQKLTKSSSRFFQSSLLRANASQCAAPTECKPTKNLLMQSTHLVTGLPCALHPDTDHSKTAFVHLPSSRLATCPAQRNFLRNTSSIQSDMQCCSLALSASCVDRLRHGSQSSKVCSPCSLNVVRLRTPTIERNIFLCNVCILASLSRVIVHVAHPYRKAG